MVRKTALTRIEEFIDRNRIRKMMKWSRRFIDTYSGRTSWYILKLKRKIRRLFNLISGDDIIEMLKDLLTQEERDQLVPIKYVKALKNLSKAYEKTKLKKRHFLAHPFKQAGFSRRKMRSFNFNISHKLWKSCHDFSERNKGGGQAIGSDLKRSIKSFLKLNSRPAPNRTIKKLINRYFPRRFNILPVRHLDDKEKVLFKNSPFKNQVSLSTFKKYIKQEKIFKKPHRFSDLCEYCEWAKSALKELNKIIIKEFEGQNLEFDHFSAVKFIKHFTEKKNENEKIVIRDHDLDWKLKEINKYLQLLSRFENVMYHRLMASMQRESYDHYRKNPQVLREKIMIVVDYKQKFLIGMSRNQINQEFYAQQQRCCLGFGIYHVENNQIKLINFDVITSDQDPQDMISVVRAFRLLRKQLFFQDISRSINEYIVFADCGKHFRNQGLVGYLFHDLKLEGIRVSLNFFVPRHGKNCRDSHFSAISKFVHSESLVNHIQSSKDIVDAILKRQDLSNEDRRILGKPPISTFAVDFDSNLIADIVSANPIDHHIKITNIESYYNYSTMGNNFNIFTSILSGSKHAIWIENISPKSVISEQYDYSETNIIGENINTIPAIDNLTFKTFFNKISRIKTGFRILNSELNKKIQAMALNDPNVNQQFNHLEEIKNNFIELDKFLEYDEIRPNNAIAIQKPNASNMPAYCKVTKFTVRNERRPGCDECNQECFYNLEQLENFETSLVQSALLKELQRHRHPTSRNIPRNDPTLSEKRTTQEALKELIAHYKYAHSASFNTG